MLIDHTLQFRTLKNEPAKNFEPLILPLKIRESIKFTNKQLFELKLLQERQCLPSFSKRTQKKQEINKLKCEIRMLLARLDKYMREISMLNVSLSVRKRMKDHFANSVHLLLLEYREMQQKYLRKIKDLQIFDDLEDPRPLQSKDNVPQRFLSQKKQNDIENVRNSMYFITSMLLEMKTIVASHSEMIDRIDFLIDETNNNLNLANIEIERIPRKYGGLKDKLIIFLIIIMIFLISILMLRFYKSRLFAKKYVIVTNHEK